MNSESLDKFYSNPHIVEHLLSQIGYDENTTFLEPSCGDGAFLKSIKGKVFAYDIAPECEGVVEQDFLTVAPFDVDIVVGNPPFGKMANTAVKFFNHCAKFNPDKICFILPRTFNKPRFWKKLDKRYTLVWKENCPKKSFLKDGKAYDVPCVMQVWKREERQDSLPATLTMFKEVEASEADIFVRRVGGKAGCVVDAYTTSSTYAVKCDEKTRSLLETHQIQLRDFASNTVGVRSITLLEIEDILCGRYE